MSHGDSGSRRRFVVRSFSAPVRLRSFGIDRPLGGYIHWQELFQFLTVDRSHFSDYPICRLHHTVHLVGLRRSLVSYLLDTTLAATAKTLLSGVDREARRDAVGSGAERQARGIPEGLKEEHE